MDKKTALMYATLPFKGTILTYNGYAPYADDNPGNTDLYDEEMTEITFDKEVNWDKKLRRGKYTFRFHLSNGTTKDYTVTLNGVNKYLVDTWKEEISHTDIEGQKNFTMTTKVYISHTRLYFEGTGTNLNARYTNGYDWYTKNYKRYANKYIYYIEII